MRLVSGIGSEASGACWMSALHWYTRIDHSWSDNPQCVSLVVRELCLALNDMCHDDEREEFIGPHLFTPIGTNVGHKAEQLRAYLCADYAVRVFAPYALEVIGLNMEAAKLRSLKPICGKISSAAAAEAMAKVAMMKAAAADSAAPAAWATAAWAMATAAAWTAAAKAMAKTMAAAAMAAAMATTAMNVANAASAAAEDAMETAAAMAEKAVAVKMMDHDRLAMGRKIKSSLLRLILECCAIGTRREIQTTKTKEEVFAMLEAGK